MPESTDIGKHEIVEEIGRRGFATVYKARDPDLDHADRCETAQTVVVRRFCV